MKKEEYMTPSIELVKLYLEQAVLDESQQVPVDPENPMEGEYD